MVNEGWVRQNPLPKPGLCKQYRRETRAGQGLVLYKVGGGSEGYLAVREVPLGGTSPNKTHPPMGVPPLVRQVPLGGYLMVSEGWVDRTPPVLKQKTCNRYRHKLHAKCRQWTCKRGGVGLGGSHPARDRYPMGGTSLSTTVPLGGYLMIMEVPLRRVTPINKRSSLLADQHSIAKVNAVMDGESFWLSLAKKLIQRSEPKTMECCYGDSNPSRGRERPA